MVLFKKLISSWLCNLDCQLVSTKIKKLKTPVINIPATSGVGVGVGVGVGGSGSGGDAIHWHTPWIHVQADPTIFCAFHKNGRVQEFCSVERVSVTIINT